ncbi:50S ribosomal protein L18 [Candidatus Micrarchaeota archaeon]|nr:50S ribosomal protein L18 [Candidatus Micrarchaeota archaeon]
MGFKSRFRRRAEGKTDYANRLRLLKSRKPRLVARVALNSVVAQVIGFDGKGDATLAGATSTELKKLGWNGHAGNCPAAYLTGLLCGTRAAKKGVKEAVLDMGLHTPVGGSNVFAVLKGAVDAGIKIPHDPKVLPPAERVTGKTLSEFRKVTLNFDDVRKKITENA